MLKPPPVKPQKLQQPHPPPPTVAQDSKLGEAWRNPWARRAAAVAVPALAALPLALAMPRGPITNGEALATMVVGLIVGLIAGFALRSRWAMLLAPLAFVVAYELTRLGTDGPTVDGIHTSTYGFMALALGRGIHGVLALLPMVLGAALGAALARRLTDGRPARRGWARAGLYARRGAVALVGVGLVALAVGIARPASTDPIVGPDGEPLPGSIAELTQVEIGGHDLAMMIRGNSIDSPVLLFLAGGPGGSELGAMRRHLEALEQDFVVVTWDQRGTGKSYGALDPASTLTLDQAISDTIEVTNYLRDRFGAEKIYLVGQSWGTTLGVLAVQRHPELYQAFVGTGQMVSQRETDRIFYEDTLKWARESGRDDVVATLTDIGPPPYQSILDYEPLLAYEKDVYPYDRSQNSEGEGQMGENLFVEEYTLLEQIHIFAGVFDTFSVLYPQLQQIDFREDATRLDVPVYLVQGRHEARGRAELANEWFEQLEAPSKKLIVLNTSGHRPLFEQPDRFHEVMTETVLAESDSDQR
jgi:pimeloyl-ACP methyl ester carboxylesterase